MPQILCYHVQVSEVLSTFRLSPGESVPEFLLPDSNGEMISRIAASGTKGLLVVFACNHCPFVIHLAKALGSLAKEIAPLGVRTVAINSNDLQRFPQDGPEYMKSFARQYDWDFPYLIDESQEVAKAFGAACTPDFFLFDSKGGLFYAGQFDDSRPRGGPQPNGGDLREAIRRMLEGEKPLVRPYPSCGCNIKWKPGNQPEWWNSGA
jgi:peroxiredoxin